jgi:hypothetical protein
MQRALARTGNSTGQTRERRVGGEPMDQPQERHPKRCDECDKPATWVRRTQFSGNHYFCTLYAQREEDFDLDDPSYFFWQPLTPQPHAS